MPVQAPWPMYGGVVCAASPIGNTRPCRAFGSSAPHSDAVREAQMAGYTVVLHVVLVTEDLAVERVAHRVRAGGHDVPESKIRERFRRLWELVAQAAELADSTTFYNNSRLDGPRIVATLSGGQVVGHHTWPAWAPTALRSRWLT